MTCLLCLAFIIEFAILDFPYHNHQLLAIDLPGRKSSYQISINAWEIMHIWTLPEKDNSNCPSHTVFSHAIMSMTLDTPFPLKTLKVLDFPLLSLNIYCKKV